ncbi:hypothetical protein [Muribaculum intestinale]|uniref:hypothetical protein n=1 Tax=Muribaculum intestinale TaxID=1796646 RepID=UPI0013A5978B|nr:hypothetical protein [Muribaculum intestinale]
MTFQCSEATLKAINRFINGAIPETNSVMEYLLSYWELLYAESAFFQMEKIRAQIWVQRGR